MKLLPRFITLWFCTGVGLQRKGIVLQLYQISAWANQIFHFAWLYIIHPQWSIFIGQINQDHTYSLANEITCGIRANMVLNINTKYYYISGGDIYCTHLQPIIVIILFWPYISLYKPRQNVTVDGMRKWGGGGGGNGMWEGVMCGEEGFMFMR